MKERQRVLSPSKSSHTDALRHFSNTLGSQSAGRSELWVNVVNANKSSCLGSGNTSTELSFGKT